MTVLSVQLPIAIYDLFVNNTGGATGVHGLTAELQAAVLGINVKGLNGIAIFVTDNQLSPVVVKTHEPGCLAFAGHKTDGAQETILGVNLKSSQAFMNTVRSINKFAGRMNQRSAGLAFPGISIR